MTEKQLHYAQKLFNEWRTSDFITHRKAEKLYKFLEQTTKFHNHQLKEALDEKQKKNK